MSNAATALRRKGATIIGVLILLAPALLLSGCQSREDELSAQVAAAQEAAERAIKAQHAAEAAAASLKAGQPVAAVAEDEPEAEAEPEAEPDAEAEPGPPPRHGSGGSTVNGDGVAQNGVAEPEAG